MIFWLSMKLFERAVDGGGVDERRRVDRRRRRRWRGRPARGVGVPAAPGASQDVIATPAAAAVIDNFIDLLLVSRADIRRAASTAPRRRSTGSDRWRNPRTARNRCRDCRTSAARAIRRARSSPRQALAASAVPVHVHDLAPVEPELHFIRGDFEMPFDAGPTRTGSVSADCRLQSVVTGGVVSKLAMSCVPPLPSTPSR